MSENQQRPPIITLMGHVDHGKTSLLDKIRSSKVQKSEEGGITQSIGAYQVDHDGRKLTFIDTPGHQAFAKMRSRGGKIADIVVLVVAADEGVKPQTEESISHARAAGARLIVALSKVDLKTANIERVKKQLSDSGIDLEDYGGEIKAIETSAETGQGLDSLLTEIKQLADNLDLKANPQVEPKGIIIESQLDPRKGTIVHAIVMEGILRDRDVVVAESGSSYGRVKSMSDWLGEKLNQADPGTPVELLGFNQPPEVGEKLKVVKDLKTAQTIVGEGTRDHVQHISPKDRLKQILMKEGIKEIPIIVKAKSQGEMEAVVDSLKNIQSEKVKIKVLHRGIGDVTENDVFLAMPVSGLILGFRVGLEKQAEQLARKEKIIIRQYKIIYHLIEELQEVMDGEIEALGKKILGKAQVKKVFDLSDGQKVAGCQVTEGELKMGDRVEIVHGQEVIGESRISSLKQHQVDVKKVGQGRECGVLLKPKIEFKVGDQIQSIE